MSTDRDNLVRPWQFSIRYLLLIMLTAGVAAYFHQEIAALFTPGAVSKDVVFFVFPAFAGCGAVSALLSVRRNLPRHDRQLRKGLLAMTLVPVPMMAVMLAWGASQFRFDWPTMFPFVILSGLTGAIVGETVHTVTYWAGMRLASARRNASTLVVGEKPQPSAQEHQGWATRREMPATEPHKSRLHRTTPSR